MISQRCPKCGSNRIRRGYRPTSFWSKLIFRYHLLCDSCNWEFTGFAVPGTVTSKPSRKHRKSSNYHESEMKAKFEAARLENEDESSQVIGMKRKKIKKTFVF